MSLEELTPTQEVDEKRETAVNLKKDIFERMEEQIEETRSSLNTLDIREKNFLETADMVLGNKNTETANQEDEKTKTREFFSQRYKQIADVTGDFFDNPNNVQETASFIKETYSEMSKKITEYFEDRDWKRSVTLKKIDSSYTSAPESSEQKTRLREIKEDLEREDLKIKSLEEETKYSFDSSSQLIADRLDEVSYLLLSEEKSE